MPDKPRQIGDIGEIVEKQASSEIAERFEKFVEEVAAHNPAGLSDIWINAARAGYQRAERDTRERLAQLARDIAKEVGGNFAETHRLNVGLNKFIKQLERIRGKE